MNCKKSEILDKSAKRYILNAIDASGYQEKELKTIKDKISFLKDTFYSEKGWEIERIGRGAAIKDWIQGLPTCLHIAFYNCDILELAKTWGSLPINPTEKQEDKILENYWSFMANKISQLFEGYHVPKDIH